MAKKKAKIPPSSTSNDPVTQYALDVTSGEKVAGPLVRLAGERHLRDLKDGPKRGLTWDFPSAEWVFGFFEKVLRLAGGEHEGKPFILQPPQKFIIGSLFGWKNSTGAYRFTTAFVEIGKGAGKSPLGGGLGIYKMTADHEPRAECYAAAVDKDQAKIPFRDAVAMVDQSPALNKRILKTPMDNADVTKVWNLAHLESGSFFRPIASENTGRGKSGFRPFFVLLDEIHEHPTDSMVEFMRKNVKGRRNGLVFMITNSGTTNKATVYWRYHSYSEKVLKGTFIDDEMFCYVCGLDKGDDWTNPKVWPKANPMIGVTIPISYLEKEVREAIGMPSKQSLTRRLNFCELVDSADPLFESIIWEANGGAVDLDRLRGRRCFGGLDLSSKNDLTALALIFEADEPYVKIYDCPGCGVSFGTYQSRCPRCNELVPLLRYVVTEANRKDVLLFAWTPADTLATREHTDQAPYQYWVDEGYLMAVPGRSIDYGFVARKIAELTALYRIECIAFDRWRIDDMKRELEDADCNITLKEWGQGFRDMNPAIEAIEEDVLNILLRHGRNPLLTSAIDNVKIVRDPAGNRKIDKEKSTGRVDPAVALAMASGLMMFPPEAEATYASTLI